MHPPLVSPGFCSSKQLFCSIAFPARGRDFGLGQSVIVRPERASKFKETKAHTSVAEEARIQEDNDRVSQGISQGLES